jgi:threonylcarbamoyladenosine tRNA methylthiotransferase MtaB
MDRPAFHTITLGCKLNQFDGAALEGELARRGYVPAVDVRTADVVVINTCTVTGKADADARRLIRGIRRDNPDCRLLVTGCYAERDPERIAAIPGVDRVFGNTDKPRFPALLDAMGLDPRTLERSTAPNGSSLDRGCDATLDVPAALHFGERSRAFLKIQEGCNLTCSYCVIPAVRGRSRSVPAERVREAMTGLFDRGYREVVLTGVNTGDWGLDLDPRADLASLLASLLDACGPNRIRLNSLEPRTVTDGIVDRMASDPRLAAHLQVPLQSGSDAVLRAMRRNYRVALYLERLERLAARVPRIGLGADVIVGFPGETDAHFEETYRTIADSPLQYLHVFAWSPRPGTPAADLDDRPHGSVVRERSVRLRDLADRKGRAFRASLIGVTLDAVVLGEHTGSDPGLRALTGNFVEVDLPAASAERGALVDVCITAVDAAGRAHARVVGVPSWARRTDGAPSPPTHDGPAGIDPAGAARSSRRFGN